MLQFTDSACPVGAFAFSCGLESAAANGIVHDSTTLKEFARVNAIQSAFSDGIAALHAHRATSVGDYESILLSDKTLFMTKMNDETRSMLCKMGRKLTELSLAITQHPILERFLVDIKNNNTPGTYPVIQGIYFSSLGINEHDLFISHQYGVINMILSAALRCIRVSHIDTQKILFELLNETLALYDEIKDYGIDEINAFFPELDLLASIHEKGNSRMFMS